MAVLDVVGQHFDLAAQLGDFAFECFNLLGQVNQRFRLLVGTRIDPRVGLVGTPLIGSALGFKLRGTFVQFFILEELSMRRCGAEEKTTKNRCQSGSWGDRCNCGGGAGNRAGK